MDTEVINRHDKWIVSTADGEQEYASREEAVAVAGSEAKVVIERRAEVTLEPQEEKHGHR